MTKQEIIDTLDRYYDRGHKSYYKINKAILDIHLSHELGWYVYVSRPFCHYYAPLQKMGMRIL